MKQFKLFGMLAIAFAMLTTACSEDSQMAVNNDVNVKFELGLNGGMGTKAAAESNADVLVYSLFDADGVLIATVGENGKAVINNAFQNGAENIALTLVKGQTYTVAFWAQNSGCDAYTVTAENDGLKVAVDYNGANNDELRDAFFASETFTVEGDDQIEVVLKRPFAQINLGVSAEDWNAAVAAGLNIVSSKAVITGVANQINLVDGSVSGETTVTYESSNIPTVATKAAAAVKDLVVGEESYKWLSMSYVLADDAKSLNGIEFTLTADNGTQIVLNEGLDNAPVQRNWTTNVLGDALTGNVNLTVTTDPVYYTTQVVSTAAEFKAALADRNIQIIKLAADIDGVFLHNKGYKVITSVDPANPATFSGVLGVAAPVDFKNLDFIPSENSQKSTGHQYIDKMQRKSIVPIYASKVSFEGCNFTDLYNSHNVVAMNYQAHKKGAVLEVNNCTFQGYAYCIYSRCYLKITNCTFDQYHPQVNPRAVFLYGLGTGENGTVEFTNNKAIGKQSYALQMSSVNYHFKNIHYNVQNNVNFEAQGVNEGEGLTPYIWNPELEFAGSTFAEGSATFNYAK